MLQQSMLQRGLLAALSFAQRALLFLVRRLRSAETKLQVTLDRQRHHLRVVNSTKYDMSEGGDEAYYLEQYLEWIKRGLVGKSFPAGASVIDLGCGQGRLTLPLSAAHRDWQLTGIDLSPTAIDGARLRATEAAVKRESLTGASASPIRFIAGDILDFVNKLEARSVQIVIFTEVSFFYPEWREVMKELTRVLAPGGVIFASFRPLYFNALLLARDRLLALSPKTFLSSGSGTIFPGDSTIFTWQRSAEVRKLAKELGLNLKSLVGIGCLSGIPGDPHAEIARPSSLAVSDRNALMALELELAEDLPDAGRYMLATFELPEL